MDTATHVSLCAGYGGIDLGLRAAIPNLRTIAFSEIEAYACANLVAKMEEGRLDAAPIWTDVKTFPYSWFHGIVDILSGGYPCQPFSTAGKRLGTDDPRHLWPYIADGIGRMRPGQCFFENVEGHVSLGLSTVVSDLEAMGYRTTWGIFSAEEVGSPQSRRRLFILADSSRIGVQGFRPDWKQEPHPHEQTGLSVRGRPNTHWDQREAPPAVCGVADGCPDWVDRLRLLGNGVVPATAELAYRTLSNRLTGCSLANT